MERIVTRLGESYNNFVKSYNDSVVFKHERPISQEEFQVLYVTSSDDPDPLSDAHATLKNLTENLAKYEQEQQVALASRISAIKTRHKALKQQLAQEREAARQSLEQIQQALQNEVAQERQEWQAAIARERQERKTAEQALQREAAEARQEVDHTRQQLEQAGEAAR